MSKRKSNNPLLLGETGAGKTAVVEGFVQHLYTRHQGGIDASPRLVVQLDVGSIMAGTHLRGALAERLKKLRDEVKLSDGQIILFIDEIHSLFGHQTDGGQDALMSSSYRLHEESSHVSAQQRQMNIENR